MYFVSCAFILRYSRVAVSGLEPRTIRKTVRVEELSYFQTELLMCVVNRLY